MQIYSFVNTRGYNEHNFNTLANERFLGGQFMIRHFKRYQCNLDVERKYSMTWLWYIYANLYFYGGQEHGI